MFFSWDLFGLNPNLHIVDMNSVTSFSTSLSNVGGLPSPGIDLFSFYILIRVLSVPSVMPYFFAAAVIDTKRFLISSRACFRSSSSVHVFPILRLKNHSNNIAFQSQIRTKKTFIGR